MIDLDEIFLTILKMFIIELKFELLNCKYSVSFEQDLKFYTELTLTVTGFITPTRIKTRDASFNLINLMKITKYSGH